MPIEPLARRALCCVAADGLAGIPPTSIQSYASSSVANNATGVFAIPLTVLASPGFPRERDRRTAIGNLTLPSVSVSIN